MEDVLARVASYAGNWHAMSLVSRGLARRRLCRAWLGAHFDRALDHAARHPEHTRHLAPGFFLRMLAAGADRLVHPTTRPARRATNHVLSGPCPRSGRMRGKQCARRKASTSNVGTGVSSIHTWTRPRYQHPPASTSSRHAAHPVCSQGTRMARLLFPK